MKVVVTGAGGFLGERVATALLAPESPLKVTSLVVTDVHAPTVGRTDPRVTSLAVDIAAPSASSQLIDVKTDVIFHLAAIVSGHAEADLDLGYRINFDATRALLDAARRINPKLRFVFTSTIGIYGEEPPHFRVSEVTAPTPRSSYGTAKAMCELLVSDYTRKGLVDGRVVRLPTVTVRAGAANRAVTSYASAIVRESLAGRDTVIPVPPEQALWVSSPRRVVRNIIHAAVQDQKLWPNPPVLNLPGLRTVAKDMAQAVETVAGKAAARHIKWDHDELIERLVASFPDDVDASRALALGFTADADFDEIVRIYIEEENLTK